jgi:hypothetical protein
MGGYIAMALIIWIFTNVWLFYWINSITPLITGTPTDWSNPMTQLVFGIQFVIFNITYPVYMFVQPLTRNSKVR